MSSRDTRSRERVKKYRDSFAPDQFRMSKLDNDFFNRTTTGNNRNNRYLNINNSVDDAYDKQSNAEVVEYANTNLPPGVYQMYKDKDGTHRVEFKNELKTVTDEVYGKTRERVLRYWKKFIKVEDSICVLLVGDSGAGKSMEAEILANVAILKGDLPVIQVTGFEVDEQTIQYLSQYESAVFYCDEFTKHVKWDKQELLLSLLTDKSKKLLTIITENEINTLSKYLRSRPGRAWYRKIFDKLEADVVLDYLSRKPGVKQDFIKSLMEKYKVAMTFTFDHLKAIVDEHLDYPDESLEDMLEILNVDILSKPKKYILTNLYKVTKDSKKKLANGTIPKAEYEEINFVNAELEIYSVEQDRYKVSIYTEQEKPSENSPTSQNMPNNNMVMFGGRDNNSRGENIQFNISNLTSKDGATHEFIVGDYKIIMVKAEPGKINEAIEKSK